MKTFIYYLIVILAFTQCSNPKPNREGATTENVPPSLQEDKKDQAEIQLTEKEQKELNIGTIRINKEPTKYTVFAPGVVFPAPEHASLISSPINGQVSRILKYEGRQVRKGEVLFYIQSLEFGTLISEYLQAYAEEKYQGNRVERLNQLVKERISSETELEQATSDHQRTMAMLKASWSKLRAIGVSEKEITGFSESANIEPVLKIYSPIDGVVEKLMVEAGQSVGANENLSRILDTKMVLIKGYLSPEDARLVEPGNKVNVLKEGKSLDMDAAITSINPGLDENNRSIVAGILVPTSGGWPKPGENVKLEITASMQKEMIAIPLSALSYFGNKPVVFVMKGAGLFEKRPIEVSEIRDDKVIVNSGLVENETIAISKIFNLKALSRFDTISGE